MFQGPYSSTIKVEDGTLGFSKTISSYQTREYTFKTGECCGNVMP